MSVRFQPFAAVGSRQASTPRGLAYPSADRYARLESVVEVDPGGAAGDAQIQLGASSIGGAALPPGAGVVEVVLELLGTGDGYDATAFAGRDGFDWRDNGAAAVTDFLTPVAQSNPVRASTNDVADLPAPASGVVAVPTPRVVLAAAALAGLGLAVDDVVWVRVRYHEGPIDSDAPELSDIGRQRFGVYIDDAVEPGFESAITSSRLLDGLSLGGSRFVFATSPAGAPVAIENCAFAAVDPNNVVYIRSTSVGVGAGQIPAQLASNQAERYAYYPSVFFRRTNYDVAALPTSSRTVAGIDTAGGAAVLMVAQRTWSHSRWTISLDGDSFDIVVSHGGIPNLMTPREIWESYLGPALLAGELDLFVPVATNGNYTFLPLGPLKTNGFVQYARFVDAYDTINNAVTPSFLPYWQTGGTPITNP